MLCSWKLYNENVMCNYNAKTGSGSYNFQYASTFFVKTDLKGTESWFVIVKTDSASNNLE